MRSGVPSGKTRMCSGPRFRRFSRYISGSFSPDKPFQYRFLDDAVEYLHREEIRLSNVATRFVVLAMLLACLGLFSLASFSAEQRTKEIAIRKMAGATSGNLFALLTRGFLQPVLLACLIGWPIAYVLMDR